MADNPYNASIIGDNPRGLTNLEPLFGKGHPKHGKLLKAKAADDSLWVLKKLESTSGTEPKTKSFEDPSCFGCISPYLLALDEQTYAVKRGDSEHSYACMPWYERDLTKPPKLTKEDKARLSLELMLAVRDMARLGFVHRDIKPGNCFLYFDDQQWHLHLGDYDICAKVGGGSQNPKRIYSTRGFSFPWRKEENFPPESSPLEDIYSVGAMLFYIYTGKPLWSEADILTAGPSDYGPKGFLFSLPQEKALKLPLGVQPIVSKALRHIGNQEKAPGLQISKKEINDNPTKPIDVLLKDFTGFLIANGMCPHKLAPQESSFFRLAFAPTEVAYSLSHETDDPDKRPCSVMLNSLSAVPVPFVLLEKPTTPHAQHKVPDDRERGVMWQRESINDLLWIYIDAKGQYRTWIPEQAYLPAQSSLLRDKNKYVYQFRDSSPSIRQLVCEIQSIEKVEND